MASDGTIRITTELDSAKAEAAMSKFSSLASKAMTGITVAVSTASAALSAMAGYSIKVGADFEAGMSKVSAISGATGADLSELTEKAKEMGAKTKFSATEASEAFQYMAMAGWKTEDMLSGIDGIMNLAAASGESLAKTSDIVTDALTAFGMAASDSSHFADVLAKASSNSNTNVAMMGETFKYVAPVAGALKFSVEDCAVAIGLMANSGIKASQAGTSMRQLFTNLVKPTDAMAQAMEDLGISMTDAEGKTKSLDALMGDLRQSFSGLSEAQKAQYAATLAGQEGMSGLLAIVNASDADFNALKTSIYNADGAAEQMADTMNDNLKGSLTIAGSALEGFGIAIYEKIQTPLKKAVDAGTEDINRLSKAFQSGGLNAVVAEAGEIFNDTADEIAGMSDEAAGVVRPIQEIVNVGGKLAKTTLPVAASTVKLLAKNFGTLAPLVVSSAAGMKSFSAIGKVTTKVVKANAAATLVLNKMEKANALQLMATNGGLTARQTLMAVYNGQITATTGLTSLWTAAQTKLNVAMTANPIGTVVVAAAALVGAMYAIKAATGDAAKAQYELSDSQKEALKSSQEITDTLAEERQAREEAIGSIDREYNKYSALLSELQSITDANGQVKAGYEERAKVITGELSEALGTEIEMTDGVIQKYGETVEAIKELIVQKKAEATVESMKDEMADSYQKSIDAAEKYKEVSKALEEQKKKVAKAEDDWEEAAKRGAKELPSYSDAVDKAKSEQEKLEKQLDNTKSSMEQLSSEVNNYDALVEAMASGSSEQIEAALNKVITGYRSFNEETLASSQSARDEMYNTANSMISTMQLVQDGTLNMADSTFQQLSKAAVDSINEFSKLPGGIAQGIKDIGPEASTAMISALAQADLDGKLDAEAQADLNSFINGFNGLDSKTKDTFAQAWYGALEGLQGFEDLADPAEQGADAFLESLRTALEVHSPSRKVEEIFSNVWPGAVQGLEQGTGELSAKGNSVITDFLNSLQSGGVLEGAKSIGSKIMNLFGLGMQSKTGNSKNAGRANATAANEGVGSIDSTRAGSTFGARYAAGVGAKAGEAGAKGRALASNAKSGAESADGYSPGSNFGSGFVRGIGSWVRSAASAAAELASAAYNAVRRTLDEHSPSRKTKKSGKNFDLGLSGGIEDNADVAVQAAEKLSERTLSALDLETLQNKIKMLNIPETMATIQTTVNSQANRSAEKAIRAVKIKEDQLWKRNNESVKTYLQDSDIQKLASEFAGIASEEFARNIDGMKMVMDRRECGRFVREVQQ